MKITIKRTERGFEVNRFVDGDDKPPTSVVVKDGDEMILNFRAEYGGVSEVVLNMLNHMAVGEVRVVPARGIYSLDKNIVDTHNRDVAAFEEWVKIISMCVGSEPVSEAFGVRSKSGPSYISPRGYFLYFKEGTMHWFERRLWKSETSLLVFEMGRIGQFASGYVVQVEDHTNPDDVKVIFHQAPSSWSSHELNSAIACFQNTLPQIPSTLQPVVQQVGEKIHASFSYTCPRGTLVEHHVRSDLDANVISVRSQRAGQVVVDDVEPKSRSWYHQNLVDAEGKRVINIVKGVVYSVETLPEQSVMRKINQHRSPS